MFLLLKVIQRPGNYPEIPFASDIPPARDNFSIAGEITGDNHTDDAKAVQQNNLAKAFAETILDFLIKKDGDAIAARSRLPFLGGAPHNQRIVINSDDLDKALNADLCKANFYGPFLFEKKVDLRQVFEPQDFLEKFQESLSNQIDLRKRIRQLHLTSSDRVIIESHRGMVLFVSMEGEMARLIGILPFGFRPVEKNYKLTRDVIYGRKYGTTLTLDILQPLQNSNGGALLEINSGSLVSVPKQYSGLLQQTQNILDAGFTVIYVTPSGIPKFSIPEIVADIQRAVRFVRYNSRRLHIHPDSIGVKGISSGGYLAQMIGVGSNPVPRFPPAPDPVSDLAEVDPVEEVSSRVQAVISYAGPSDWLNFGKEGRTVFEHELPELRSHLGIFDLLEFDPDRYGFNTIKDRNQQLSILKTLSPVNRVTPSAAPTLIFHGEKDPNVPVQQAEILYAAPQKAGVEAELIIKRGEGHGWNDTPDDTSKIIDWLHRHFQKKK